MKREIIVSKMIELANLINYEPADISFLTNAMYCQIKHKDSDGINRKNYTNDSYATLGDTILKFILTEHLFNKGYDKNEITRKKEPLERNSTLYDLCDRLKIFKYAYNDYYFYDTAPPENRVPHPAHDVYIEAIIAAIYKDRGLDYCKEWVMLFMKRNNILCD